MARSGGTYSLPAGNPVVTGTTISTTWANTTLSDIGTEITNSLPRDGTAPPTANIPMGNFKLTGIGAATAASDVPQYAQIQTGLPQYLTGVAGTDTITASLSTPTLTAYATANTFRFIAANTNTGAATININALGAKAITKNGTTALAAGDLVANAAYQIFYDGTRFQLGTVATGFTGGTVANATTFSSTVVFNGASTVNQDMTFSGSTLKLVKGADVASATALPLITDGNYFDVTGTTTITSFNTMGVGTWIRLHFDAALTLTHQAADLVLPGGANITTAANDEAEFIEYASGDWRCVSYTKATGQALTGGVTRGTAVASTSGTAINFTSISSDINVIILMLAGVSTNGTSALQVQIGDSGGLENTSYVQTSAQGTAAFLTGTTGFALTTSNVAAAVYSGMVILVKQDGNTWCSSGNVAEQTSPRIQGSAGYKTLSATLDRFTLSTVGGTDTFDAGSVNWVGF